MTIAEAARQPDYTPELADLMEHEKNIEQGISSMLDMASSFEAIRDGRKYRAAGFSNFEDYCKQRWGVTRQRVAQVIDGGKLARELSNRFDVSPINDAQVRPLKALPDAESRAEAWNEAVENAGGNQPTAKQVKEAVARRTEPEPTDGEKLEELFERYEDEAEEESDVTLDDIVEAIRETREPEPSPVRKKDRGNNVHHPAPYSGNLLPFFAEILGYLFEGEPVGILDPFGGTGRIHELEQWGHDTCAVEIEPEWANLHPRTLLGSALDLPWVEPSFDAIVTSPTYGNRLADSHNASDADRRFSYTHDLGRKLHEDNSGAMHWGPKYRDFHEKAWTEALRVLKDDGVFILNIKDHIRGGVRQHVAGWHVTLLCRMGLTLLEHHEMRTKNLAVGANATERLNEQVYVFVKGAL